jgi:hypothetical protein
MCSIFKEGNMTDSELEQALWEVIRAVAATDPLCSDDWDDHCIYCDGYEYCDGKFVHKPDCTYLKAKALAEKGIFAE